MLGYEKVNKRVASRPVAALLDDPRVQRPAPSKRRPKPKRRLIDLSVVAAESPGESIARENEIVARLALADDQLERPSEHCIAEQLMGLVDPAVIRAL